MATPPPLPGAPSPGGPRPLLERNARQKLFECAIILIGNIIIIKKQLENREDVMTNEFFPPIFLDLVSPAFYEVIFALTVLV